jgi:hypothetical protein
MPGGQQSLPTERLIVSRMDESRFDLAARSYENVRRRDSSAIRKREPVPETLSPRLLRLLQTGVVPKENRPPGAAA